MADENISIEIADTVSPSISNKLVKIAENARAADAAVKNLKTQLGSLNTSALANIQAATQGATQALQQNALAAQRLATEQQRTASAAAQAAAAQQRVATAATQSQTAAQNLAAATTRANTAQAQGQTAAQRLATEQARTATQTANAAAASDRAALAALRYEQAQQRAGQAAKNMDSTIGPLVGRLATLVGTVISLKSAIGAADEYQALANKLQIVSDSSAQVSELQGRLFDVANRTRASVEATTTSFARFDNALISLGKSQEDSLRLTETINKLFVIGGATASEQAGAMVQLSQAFNSGTLQGEEFRSVAENMPKAVRTAIAETLKINESALKKAASEGKITADVLFNAFKKLDEFADSKFAKMVRPISQELVVLKNTFIEASGEMDKNLGIVSSLVEFMTGLGNIILQVGDAFGALGKEQDNVSTGSAILKGLLEAVLVVLQTVIVITSDVIFVFKMVGLEIGAIAAQLVALANLDFNGFSAISEAVKADGVKARKELDDFQARIMGITTNPVQRDKANGGAASTLRGAGKSTFKPATSDNEIKAAEKRATALAKINAELDNELSRMYMLKPEREAQARFDQIEEQLLGKKIKLSQDEAAALKEKIKAIQEAKDIQQAYDRIYEEAVGPQRDYNANLTAAQKLLSQGVITQQQYNQQITKAGEAYKQATDPLYQYNKELNQQQTLLQMLPKQREVEQQIMQISNDLLQKGVVLTQAETAALREKLLTIQQLNAVSQQEASLMDASVNKRQSFIDQMTAIKNLRANQQSGFTSGDQANAVTSQLGGMGLDTSNLQVQAEAYTAQYQTMYDQIAQMRAADLINEQDAAALRLQVWQQQQSQQLNTASNFFGQLSGLQKSKNKELAAIGKAAAITQAVINTYQSATAAYAAMASIPYVGPALGAAAAAAAIAAGMANVAQIRSQSTGYKTGGYTGSIGVNEVAGVVHGREYVMDANATSRIGVANLQALQNGAAVVQQNSTSAGAAAPAAAPASAGNGKAGGNVGNTTNLRIINTLDPNLVGEYLGTPEGEQVFVNAIRKNADSVRQAISNG